jgi:hypothetical protein
MTVFTYTIGNHLKGLPELLVIGPETEALARMETSAGVLLPSATSLKGLIAREHTHGSQSRACDAAAPRAHAD